MEIDHSLHPLGEVSDVIRKKRYRIATRRGYLALLRNVIIMGLFIVVVFTQVFLLTAASGTNMYPAVLDGDIVVGYRLDHNYEKEDVVVCQVDDKTVISRVVAKAGDQVMITAEGTLSVNGAEQTGEIAFPTYPGDKLTFPYVVPEGCLFLLGDFRTKTWDSRSFGPVPVENVQAKVVSILRRRGI